MPPEATLACAIIGAVFFVSLAVIGVFLLFGKGGFLVSGYNFVAKGERAKHYERILLQPIGIGLIVMGALLGGSMCLFGFDLLTWGYIGMGAMFIVVIILLIYTNTSKKMKRAEFLSRKLTENPFYIVEEEEEKKNKPK